MSIFDQMCDPAFLVPHLHAHSPAPIVFIFVGTFVPKQDFKPNTNPLTHLSELFIYLFLLF